MLAAYPLTTAKAEPLSLPGVARHINEFFLQGSSNKGQWACHTHQWFRLQRDESNNSGEGQCTVEFA